MKKIILLRFLPLAIIIGLSTFAYTRYWNIAYVNGMPISRLAYFKMLETQGGQQVLAQMIEDALIINEWEKNKVTVDDKVISDEISKIEEKLKSQGNSLEEALKANNLTREALEAQIRIKKTQDILSVSKTEITQAQIDEFLKANKALLPKDKSKDELQALAKEQLKLQADAQSATEWLENIRSSAKIIYK
jgi:hypothetical protein